MIWGEAAVHWLHLMAAVVWIGGMVFIAGVLNPLLRERLAPEIRLPLLREAGRRFLWVEWGAFAVLLATGLWKLSQRGPWSQAFDGDWGNVLAVKLSLVAFAAVLSVLHSLVWGPRLASVAPGSTDHARLTRRLVIGSRVGIVLALAVVFCAALLRMNPF